MDDADRIRDLLARLGLSQRAAARELGITDRTMRRYCAGYPVPRVVMMALAQLAQKSGHRFAAGQVGG